ncbi:CRISPR-associated helicase Cas3' [bacterium]|nr:MAG: CRISPR-associated helicase Cas3' [bacterium]
MSALDNYNEFFRIATGGAEPYPYQRRLAEQHVDFVRVQTGLGKTEALVLGWLWRRLRGEAAPRKLVYVLPMRSLVEQTRSRVQDCIGRLAAAGIDDLPKVEIVMGGDIGEEWYENPEGMWVVIGTQDALLSRALNRGYAMSRFQWPMTFGAINNDAQWVIDEVQLQGIGAVTATQLQSFRERFGTYGETRTTLASATLDTSWFESADYSLDGRITVCLSEDDLANANVQRITNAPKTLERLETSSESDIASAVLEKHRPGTQTLVVVNTVTRAKEICRRLQRAAPRADVMLLHSRFRPEDRITHANKLSQPIDQSGPGRIVVATQVIEAGIDITSAILFTEAAPWSSVVQRLGRCNRRGVDHDARVIWIDTGAPTAKSSQPYALEEIQQARTMLETLVGQDLAPAKLPALSIDRGRGLVLRPPDLLDLFDTSPDLAGHDIDVSPYIRDADDFTVSIFWRDQPPTSDAPPRREELCPATVGDLKKVLDELRAAGHNDGIRIADQFARAHAEWVPLTPEAVRPGLLVWLHVSVGRYDSELGFDLVTKARVNPIEPKEAAPAFHQTCDSIDGDQESEIGVAQTITEHGQWTREEAAAIVEQLSLSEHDTEAVARAALWHDVGKAHPVFQRTMRASMPDADQDKLWAKSVARGARHERKGFRHELPGALAYLAAYGSANGSSLIAYLIASHHGKLRVAPTPLPYERQGHTQYLLGNRDGDRVPAVSLSNGESSPEIDVSLAAFRVGTEDGSSTWVDRVMGLRDDVAYGPFKLAYLELLVRVADWRASRRAAKVRP